MVKTGISRLPSVDWDGTMSRGVLRTIGCGWKGGSVSVERVWKGCETGDETPKADPIVSQLKPSITKTKPSTTKTHPSTRPHPPGDVEATAAHQARLSL